MRLSQAIWTRFLPTKLVVSLATLGPVGKRLPAPGTWGSVAGLLYFTVFFAHLGIFPYLFFCAIACYLAVCLCGEAELRLGLRDPGKIILDEFVAMPLCFLDWQALTPVAPAWAVFLAGFALFRFYDILKPLGISRLQNLPGGWGVVADDLAAALASCASLHLIGWWLRSRH